LFSFLDPFTKLRKATIIFVVSVRLSVRPSIRMEHLGPTGRICMKLNICGFFENISRKFKCN